jgi:glycerol-3-phosphate dehydrogenase
VIYLSLFVMPMYDVVIVGAGVTGSACARELSRYRLSVCVLERGDDLCSGTSKANSGIVHAGHDARPGTLKAKLNVEGNAMMGQLTKDLDIPFRRNGSLVICTEKGTESGLEELKARGEKNGVPGLKIISGDEARALEPSLSDGVIAALLAPTGGIICPFELNIAMAENAYENGVDFFFNTEVCDIVSKPASDETRIWHIRTNNGEYRARYVINAAGLYADAIHNMVSADKMEIIPRRGEYCLFDHEVGETVDHTIFQQPTSMGKGVLVTPTIHGNLMIGPTSVDIDDKEGVNTTAEGLDVIMKKASVSIREVPYRKVITSFAGLRAHEKNGDFIIGEVKDAPGFIDVAAIDSPGLSSCPAIGKMVGDMFRDKLHLQEKDHWKATRKGILKPSSLSTDELNELIKREPAYGQMICRCESVTEGEIIDAVRRPLGARSLDGIKRRTRTGMGRCQAGFCSPKVMGLLHRELGIDMDKIRKSDAGSNIVSERTKSASAGPDGVGKVPYDNDPVRKSTAASDPGSADSKEEGQV